MRRIVIRSLTVVLAVAGFSAPVNAQSVFNQCLSNGTDIGNTFPPVVETINVSGVGVANDVQVTVSISHTWVGDVTIDLQGPNTASTRLHDLDGGNADNFDLIYSDVGAPNGSDSFNCGCVMAPSGPGTLQDLLGGGPNGDWVLTVGDLVGGDDGTLDNWCIDLFEQTPPVPIQNLFCLSAPGSGFADVSWSNPISYDAINIYIGGTLTAVLAGNATSYMTPTFPTPTMLTIEVEGMVGAEVTTGISCAVTLPEEGATVGPDVTYQDCTSITQFGTVGSIHAYALGSWTCNRGPANLPWGGTSPLLAMNAYRLTDGRLEQIGMSWVKNGTGAAVGAGCGPTCNGQGGSVLGSGCRDIYGSSFNGLQSILGPRSAVNAFTGTYPGASGTGGTAIAKRLQVEEAEMFDGPQYFVEGVYVAEADAANGNAHNNASYKPASVNTATFDMTPTGSMAEGIPAIQAWRDHGLGPNTVDTSVEVFAVDIPGEGRFHVAYKTEQINSNTWRYEYAVFNLNSHRSGGSFSVPLNGVVPSNIGFNDVDYHTGEPYDNTDWSLLVSGANITWTSPQTFAQDPNSNALRWGTMYNFWFEADAAPAAADATLGLFRPGTPDNVSFSVLAPEGLGGDVFLRGDVSGDGLFDGLTDALYSLNYGFTNGAEPPCLEAADTDSSGDYAALTDTLIILLHSFSGGPPPAAPYPVCGADPMQANSLGCLNPPPCP